MAGSATLQDYLVGRDHIWYPAQEPSGEVPLHSALISGSPSPLAATISKRLTRFPFPPMVYIPIDTELKGGAIAPGWSLIGANEGRSEAESVSSH